jgi:phage shock protein C
MNKRLVRRPADGKLAGVCAGIAEYTNLDVTFIRLAWVILTIVPGAIIGGLLAYAIAWLIMPTTDVPAVPPEGARLRRSGTDRKVAGVCGGLAEYFHIDPTVVRLAWALLSIWPGVIIGGVMAYLLAWLVMPRERAAQFQTVTA